MKKLVSLVLIGVFALSFFIGVGAPQIEAKPKLPCKATCDTSVWMTLVCCKIGQGQNWDCHYTTPCGPGEL